MGFMEGTFLFAGGFVGGMPMDGGELFTKGVGYGFGLVEGVGTKGNGLVWGNGGGFAREGFK
jgi:hypothetical protein